MVGVLQFIDNVRDVVMNAWKLVDNLVFLNELYFSNGSYRSLYCIAYCIPTLQVITPCVAFECTLFVTTEQLRAHSEYM
jgi:hypothetical protein